MIPTLAMRAAFGDDVTVRIDDPIAFARWHLGYIEWADAVRSGAITVEGPRDLRRALPTWNRAPEAHGADHRDPIGGSFVVG